jgi:exodeoxyribonuclease-3
MRIITWNVNGLRAALGKGAWDWLQAQEADVVCLQEIKARPEQLSPDQLASFGRYQAIWNPAERPGYSGVASFLRADCLETRCGLGNSLFDVEGRVIQTRQPGFILFNVYFPSGQRGYERVRYKLDFYACLLEACDALHAAGERVVICGDFNTAHREIDLRYPKQNQKTSGFLPEERAWIDTFLAHGFKDAFRELYPDRVAYTWWTYRLNARLKNIGWRLDYFLVSSSLMASVSSVEVHDDVTGSDHCPVALVLDDLD